MNDSDIGYCDFCNEPHINGSTIDHCGECGNCYRHCTCTKKEEYDED